jgi:hypothetical protein
MPKISKLTSDDEIFGNLAQGHPSMCKLLCCGCPCLGFPNISTPCFRLNIDVEIQGIKIEADWGGIKTDFGDFSFDFSPVDISTDSIN